MHRSFGTEGQYTGWYSLLGALLPLLLAGGLPGVAEAPYEASVGPGTCLATDAAMLPPGRVELDPTRSGVGFEGWMELTFARSPHGVAVAPDGRYVYDVVLGVRSQRTIEGRTLVAWATTPELDQVRRLGILGEEMSVSAQVDWNKFLVLVTAETSAELDRWQGPILLTGMSPSGKMHTMAGHGIFEAHGIGC